MGQLQVMMIPDLDEGEAEDLTLQVAAAPKSTARRLQSLEQVTVDFLRIELVPIA